MDFDGRKHVGWYSRDGLSRDMPWAGSGYGVFIHFEDMGEDDFIFINNEIRDTSLMRSLWTQDVLEKLPTACISFERDADGEPIFPLEFTSEGVSHTIDETPLIRAWVRRLDYSLGECITVHTPQDITEALNEFAKDTGLDTEFIWNPDIFDHNVYSAAELEAENEGVAKELNEIVDAIKQLPPNSVIAWSDDFMSFQHPYCGAWIDVMLHGLQEGMGLNWVWTIVAKSDYPAQMDTPSSMIVWPQEAVLKYTLDEEDNFTDCMLVHKDHILETWPEYAPGNEEMSAYGRKIGREQGCTYAGEYSEAMWTPDQITEAITNWVKEHAGRDDIRFVWAEYGQDSKMLQIAKERLQDSGELVDPEITHIAGEMIRSDDGWWTHQRVRAYRAFINTINGAADE